MRTTKKFTTEAFDNFYPQYKDVLGGATMVINAVYDGHSKTAALVRKAAAVQKALLHFNEELIRTYKVSYYAPETEELMPGEKALPSEDYHQEMPLNGSDA
jgi:hypothetical protein